MQSGWCVWKVVTTFDVCVAKEERAQSGRIPDNSRCREQIEFESTVIHRVIGSTLAAETAAVANVVDRQLNARLAVEAFMKSETEGGRCLIICRKHVQILRRVKPSWICW